MRAKCPFCDFVAEAEDSNTVLKAAIKHLLADTPCGEKAMRRIVGLDEEGDE